MCLYSSKEVGRYTECFVIHLVALLYIRLVCYDVVVLKELFVNCLLLLLIVLVYF